MLINLTLLGTHKKLWTANSSDGDQWTNDITHAVDSEELLKELSQVK